MFIQKPVLKVGQGDVKCFDSYIKKVTKRNLHKKRGGDVRSFVTRNTQVSKKICIKSGAGDVKSFLGYSTSSKLPKKILLKRRHAM